MKVRFVSGNKAVEIENDSPMAVSEVLAAAGKVLAEGELVFANGRPAKPSDRLEADGQVIVTSPAKGGRR